MTIISSLNGFAVGVYGMVLSASFCDIVWIRRKKIILAGSMACLMLAQGMISYLAEPALVRYLYPLIMHFPLALVLVLITREKVWSVTSVFTAYLCCQLRRWLALLLVVVVGQSGNSNAQEWAEVVITLPLLIVLLKYLSPAARSISHGTPWVLSQFGLLPMVYYIFDYATHIYTDLLASGSAVVTEFMTFVFCFAYVAFVIRFSEEKWLRTQLEQTQDNLNLQVQQAMREITTLRDSEQKIREYRHDLRHHMQYISSCIENQKLDSIKEYINEIYTKIEQTKMIIFCENETANLIISAFKQRAEEKGISMTINTQISQNVRVTESDLCVLLSNVLENALNACYKMKDSNLEATIDLSAFERNSTLFIQVSNDYNQDITFVEGVPVTKEMNHGIGVRSICALVERYEGMYSFELKDGKFVLRVAL